MVTFRACIVAAVSTPGQAEDGRHSIPAQIADGRAACERAGWPVVAEVVIPGHSRDYSFLHDLIADCPEYAQLVDLIEAESVTLLVCRHYDRLWRNDWIRADLMRLCTIHRVQVYSVEQPRPPQPPETLSKRAGLSAIMEVLSGALSEEEQAIRTARLRVGMRGRVEQGYHHSSRRPPYGYVYTPDRSRLVPCPEEAAWVRYIFEQRTRGKSYKAICRALDAQGVPTPGGPERDPGGHVGAKWAMTTVRGVLKKALLYRGVAYWGKYRSAEGAHEALISADLAASAKRMQRAHLDAYTQRRRVHHWLRGLVYCGYCYDEGRVRRVRTRVCHWQSGDRIQFYCPIRMLNPGECRPNYVMAHVIEGMISVRIVAALQDPSAWLASRETGQIEEALERDIERLTAAVADNRARRDRWTAAYESGSISADELVTHRSRLDSTHADLARDLTAARARLANREATAERMADMCDLADQFADLPIDAKAEIAAMLINRVYVRSRSEPVVDWL